MSESKDTRLVMEYWTWAEAGHGLRAPENYTNSAVTNVKNVGNACGKKQ